MRGCCGEADGAKDLEKRESRTRYTAEQKVEILREAEQPGVTVSEVCRR
ncbi:MAG: transposase, partial [Rhodospirillales bacterium]|nr:transposase [Rhodospirillales bacterium]